MKKILILLVVISIIGVLMLGSCKEEAAPTEEVTEEAAEEEVTEEEAVPAEEEAEEAAVSIEDQLDTPMGSGTVYYLAPEMLGTVQVMYMDLHKQYGEELGYTVVELVAGNQSSEQLRQLDDAIAQNPAAILLNAVDAATVTAGVEKAQEAGIKVIDFARELTENEFSFTSTLSTVKMGEVAGIEMVRLLKEKYGEEKGVILEVMGDAGDNYAVLLNQGFKSVIDQYPNIELISKNTPQWETVNTVNIVTDNFTARDDIDAIFIHWDGRVPWIFPALEEKGYDKGDIIIVSTDGTPEGLDMIREGWLQATVNFPVFELTYGPWIWMDEILADEEIALGDVKVINLDCEMVMEDTGPTLLVPGNLTTPDTVDDPSLWANQETGE